MIIFIILYIVSLVSYYFLAKKVGVKIYEPITAFLVFICMFIPIINTVVAVLFIISYLIDHVDWISFVNKFFKLK
jgi:hypothetical protein